MRMITVRRGNLSVLVKGGYSAFKVFMTNENLRLRDGEILATLDAAKHPGALVLVHYENEDAIRFLIGQQEEASEFSAKSHATTRPVATEREATHHALSRSEIVDIPIVIVHASNRQAMANICHGRNRIWWPQARSEKTAPDAPSLPCRMTQYREPGRGPKNERQRQ
jgi:dihydropyrimidinase